MKFSSWGGKWNFSIALGTVLGHGSVIWWQSAFRSTWYKGLEIAWLGFSIDVLICCPDIFLLQPPPVKGEEFCALLSQAENNFLLSSLQIGGKQFVLSCCSDLFDDHGEKQRRKKFNSMFSTHDPQESGCSRSRSGAGK